MKTLIIVLATIGAAVGLSILTAYPVMWLWNWKMPDLFGLPSLTFWDAFWLRMLVSLLAPAQTSSSSKS